MKNHSDTAQTPKELLSQLQALVVEAETLMTGSVSEQAGETLTDLRERFGTAQERLAELYAGAKKKVVAGAKFTDATIRENPYQSLVVALGVGVLAGMLIGRRSH